MGVQPAKVKSLRPVSESRKIRKPLMERKRRERINTCLKELAGLLQESQALKLEKGKTASKLEKADILELTVKHLQSLRKASLKPPPSGEQDSLARYREGFLKCVRLVEVALEASETEALKQRVLQHLTTCLQSFSTPDEGAAAPMEDEEAPSKDETRLTLLPTTLPDGGLAFVVQGDTKLLLKTGALEDEQYSFECVAAPPADACRLRSQCPSESLPSCSGPPKDVFLRPPIFPPTPPPTAESPPFLLGLERPYDLSVRKVWRPW